MRLDKWLWAARFFKTRSQAKAAIEGGHVRLNGARTKAAKEVRRGDALVIRRGEIDWMVSVAALSHRRGNAAAAAELYEETAASAQRREAAATQRQAERAAGAAFASGRPSKKERRQLKAWRTAGRN